VSCDYSKLNGKIKEVFSTQENFAKALGIGRTTLNQRLNGKSDFTQSEIKESIMLLKIPENEVVQYFFKHKV